MKGFSEWMIIWLFHAALLRWSADNQSYSEGELSTVETWLVIYFLPFFKHLAGCFSRSYSCNLTVYLIRQITTLQNKNILRPVKWRIVLKKISEMKAQLRLQWCDSQWRERETGERETGTGDSRWVRGTLVMRQVQCIYRREVTWTE